MSPLSGLFGIDLRSLAAFRIGLGLLLLWDLYGRSKTLRLHYTGEGVFPREVAAVLRPDSALFHLFLWSDRVAVQALLFGLFAVLALLLLVGYRTRIVSILSFLFLVSLVRRNPYACHTGDAWLKALLFWAMFLPLGAHFSLDRWRGRGRPPEVQPVLSLATAGVLLQILVFYVSAGYLKARYDVWLRGDAVWVFTHAIEYTRPFGQWLGQFRGACRFLTLATLGLEGLAPFLFFFPFATPWIRSLLFLVFASFHLTLQATIHIGIFQIICIVALTLMLPGLFWDGLARIVPPLWRERWVALRTSLRGATDTRTSMLSAPEPLRLLRARSLQVFLVLVLAVVLVSNLNTARKDPYDRDDKGPLPLPQLIDDYGRQLGLVQNWNMFTDIDRLFLGWFLVLGQQEDGQIVDLLAHGPVGKLVRPEHYARFFPNHNSRRYWREVAQPGREFLQKPLCDCLAREWEREGGARLTHLAVFHVGRVPSQQQEDDQVKRICTWEGSHPPLKDVPPETKQRWIAWRESWTRYLASLPKTVAASE